MSQIQRLSKERMRPIRDEVYDIIKNEILKGNYEPQERLKEAEIAEKLGVSRTPVREAMRKLEIDGLVNYSPHKGIVVADVDKSEIAEIYEVRKVIEVLIVRKAAENITDEMIERLKKNIEKLKVAVEKEEILALTDEFNKIIYSASQYNKLVSIMQDIREYFRMVRVSNHLNPKRRKDAILEHERIVMALEKRDSVLAEKYTIEHIESSKRFIE